METNTMNELKKTDLIKLDKVGLFSERPSITDAIEFAQSMKDIHVTTAVMILFNTIAENYYLVPKENIEESELEIVKEGK